MRCKKITSIGSVLNRQVPLLEQLRPGRSRRRHRHARSTVGGAHPARIDAFSETWGRSYPASVESLLADRRSLTTYLRFPIEHHKRGRHANFIERTFGETRRRVKYPYQNGRSR
ncbi:transposase [Planomonospora algeriensis]